MYKLLLSSSLGWASVLVQSNVTDLMFGIECPFSSRMLMESRSWYWISTVLYATSFPLGVASAYSRGLEFLYRVIFPSSPQFPNSMVTLPVPIVWKLKKNVGESHCG